MLRKILSTWQLSSFKNLFLCLHFFCQDSDAIGKENTINSAINKLVNWPIRLVWINTVSNLCHTSYKIIGTKGYGGGLVVSTLALYSDSNLAEGTIIIQYDLTKKNEKKLKRGSERPT